MTEVISEIAGVHEMAKERYIQTSIRVPESKYTVLEEIKKIEDNSITALVLEGIDLVIKDRAEELEKNLDKRMDSVKKVLKELTKEDK